LGRESGAYEAACEVDAERTAVLAYVDVTEEWKRVQADAARVVVWAWKGHCVLLVVLVAVLKTRCHETQPINGVGI
jgi:hypothetical protein